MQHDFFLARIVLLILMVAGDRLLHAMRLTDASLEIAGGVILFLIAMAVAVDMLISGLRRAFPGVTG